MAEVSGITELQLLQAEIVALETTYAKVQAAPPTSAVSLNMQVADGFLEGSTPNSYHSSVAQGGDGGCCVVQWW